MLAFFVVEDKWTMAEVKDFMEVDKSLFNLHVKNGFYCYITPAIMTHVPQTSQ
jgi:hypothetical protein